MTDDLKLLDELGTSLDPLTCPPTGLRTRVMTTVTSTNHRLGLRQWLGTTKAPARLVAGLATVVVIATAGSLVYRGDDNAGRPAPGSTSALNGTGILLAAAHTAGLTPKLSARADQFVLVETTIERTAFEASHIPNTVGTTQRQIWRSVSGKRPGLLIDPGNPDQMVHNGPLPLPPDGRPAYRDDVPTDANAALTFLYEHSEGDNPPDMQAFTTAVELLPEAYLPPASLSAVFAALAKIPGVTVIRDVRDAAGRSGIAVGLVTGLVREELIFSSDTHVLLGVRIVLMRQSGTFPPGTITSSTAITRVAIVDHPGRQR